MSVLSVGLAAPVAFAVAAEDETSKTNGQLIDTVLLDEMRAAGAKATAQARREAERRRREARERAAAKPTPKPKSGGGQPAGGKTPGNLAAIAACESGGDPSAIGGGGAYRGKYQFSRSTWASVGGSGDPAAASEAEQDRRAAMLYARTGASSWPTCGS